MNRCWRALQALLALPLIVVLVLGTVGCQERVVATEGSVKLEAAPSKPERTLEEVSPPETIQELRSLLEVYQPQISIVSPKADTTIEDDTVTIKLQVRDLPTFKNETLGLGPYLNLILDNQPNIPIYDPTQPVVLENLSPGTHTLRVFASRPWHESFKNEGAYAQTTFHLYTPTNDNNPDGDLPLLTYSRPQGSYGAEPILLDFYLTNAPLHLVAQESDEDEVLDWRVRCTVNGKSFVIDRWQPLYLRGFKPGQNWVKLEFLDELGNLVKNVFNDTVRVITYEPGGDDTLSQIVRGELSATEARGIVDPNYIYIEETEEPEESETEELPEAMEESETEELPEAMEESETEDLPEAMEETQPELIPEEEELTPISDEVEEPILESEVSEELEQLPEEVVTEEVVTEEGEAEAEIEAIPEGTPVEDVVPEPVEPTLNEETEAVDVPESETPVLEEMPSAQPELLTPETPAMESELEEPTEMEDIEPELKEATEIEDIEPDLEPEDLPEAIEAETEALPEVSETSEEPEVPDRPLPAA